MSYENLDPAAAKERLDGEEGWTYLDVRTPEEFAAGHPPGAFNIPFAFRGPMGMEPNPGFAQAVARAFEPEAALVVGCASGVRSVYACEALAAQGFARLVNMTGGYSGSREVAGWVGRSFPVTTQAEPGRAWSELG